MHRIPVVALAAVLLAALTATIALGALPKKGGVYEGTLYAGSTVAISKIVRIKVATSGKSGRVIWYCGSGRAPTTLQFPIARDGTFKAYSKTGSLTLWSIVGRFLSSGKARAALRLNTACDGKGGTVTLKLKT